jgi:hypothetical protein
MFHRNLTSIDIVRNVCCCPFVKVYGGTFAIRRKDNKCGRKKPIQNKTKKEGAAYISLAMSEGG